ncbi:hypothetical protein [Reichenbachiella sp. MALMAid0571]|uniref:hypothetical protein n=1 Tax=Reichenbachiella sp. MALMAid0571 TaxID=3143939 RepID=UPI0032DE6DEF
MSNKTLRVLGISGGFLVIFLATLQFMKSYQDGEPKWYNLVMISGMSLILFYTIFKKSVKPKKTDKTPTKNKKGSIIQ